MSLNCCSNCIPSILHCYLENRELELQIQRQKAEINRLKFQQQLRSLTEPSGDFEMFAELQTVELEVKAKTQWAQGPEELSEEMMKKYEHYGKTLKFQPPSVPDYSSKSTPRRRKPSSSDHDSALDDSDLIPTKEPAKPLNQIRKSIEKLRESAESLHLAAKSVQTSDVGDALRSGKGSIPLTNELTLELQSKSTSMKPEMSFSGSKHRTSTPHSSSSSRHSYRLPSPLDSLRDLQRLRFSSTLMSPLKESDLLSGGQRESNPHLASLKGKFSIPPIRDLFGTSTAGRESSDREQKPGFTLEDLRKSSPHMRSGRFGTIPKSSRGERYLPVTEANGGLFSENGTEITVGSVFESSLRGSGNSKRGGFRVYKDLEEALRASTGSVFRVSCSDPSYT